LLRTYLRGKLALKGGTALNFFYLNLTRLSVDIDLNYIGHIDREATLRDRPEISKAVEQIFTGLGYSLQNGIDDYALREWYLNFTNHANRPDRIQVEINFLDARLRSSAAGNGRRAHRRCFTVPVFGSGT
jgi:predicted nucleotidyltransferase component of viral defense system